MAFRGGGGAGFRGGSVAQFRGGGAAFRGAAISPRFGQFRGGQRFVGRNFVGRNFHGRRFVHRFGPGFAFAAAPFYAYGASYYDDCYETRLVRGAYGWRYVQVYVCGYDYY